MNIIGLRMHLLKWLSKKLLREKDLDVCPRCHEDHLDLELIESFGAFRCDKACSKCGQHFFHVRRDGKIMCTVCWKDIQEQNICKKSSSES